jgi:glutamate/tyrosine decarboxylase-like PLP-dependent enzyme
MSELGALVRKTAEVIVDYRDSLAERRVGPEVGPDDLRAASSAELPDSPTVPDQVIDELIAKVEPGLVASDGPRYFGFVIGGSLDAALCADLLTTGWDQVAFNPVASPAAAVVEEEAGSWLKDLLGIPPTASFGFVTGGQAANTVGLAAARHHMLGQLGWDVERDGLHGAPPVRVLAGAERHATVDRSLRLLGFGSGLVESIPADRNGALDVNRLEDVLAGGGLGRDSDAPVILCAQAGNVNTGACDDLATACDIVHRRRGWVHVDGAFGLWAAATPATRHLVAGAERADSWACDGHKWLNVPFDSGYAFCAHPDAHVGAMAFTAAYLVGQGGTGVRTPSDFVPESGRRARGFATWAALRQLGRSGVAEMVERCCRLARRFASILGGASGVEIVNDVVLNQVLVRFGSDERTDRVVEAVQRDGTCWMGGTTWHGMRLMRIAVCNWSTTEQDVDRCAAAILAAAKQAL